MTANHTTKRRKDLHGSVFIVVLVVLFGVMVWFFNAHSGLGHRSGGPAAAEPAPSASTTAAH